ncbi:uncharacterized protein B0H18DRAFT_1211856 [Fomitopsis serialis]|uniref:uncharacterized protein n=1 Tax=Fomitopsis serialis TaxID=139415 RepID=UPI00200739AD|nr:uncharacterized protein B0H18DRAFT_1211856 [Neoantrodia serialis]KAH9924412.1 hypothetical protein B0H18DRAFT_1211856 [Neoantrodia serialis]
MLCAVGRNGFVESLAVSRHNRQVVISQCRLRHANASLSSIAHRNWAAKPSGALVAYQLSARLLSTSTPPPGTTKTKNASPPPIPASTSKSKVQLRPAPVKPGKPSAAPAEPVSAPTKSTGAPALNAATSESAPSTTHAESVIEATKHDLEDASQHGILVPPPEGASRVGKLWHQAKELFKFYWRGIKLIWTRRARVREMEERVKAGGPPLARWEVKFIRTNNRDTLKLVPFLLMVIIIEEIIPLVVLYAPGVLPSTCLLPSQKERIDTKRREKQKTYALNNRQMFEKLRQRLLANPTTPARTLLDSPTLIALNGILALSTNGLDALRFRRLHQHLMAIAEDDALLKRESLGQFLNQERLREALEERGIITEGLPPMTWHARLQWWLTNVEGGDPFIQRVLLVASSGAGKFA